MTVSCDTGDAIHVVWLVMEKHQLFQLALLDIDNAFDSSFCHAEADLEF